MTRKDFEDVLTTLVEEYINLFDQFGPDAQLQINPTTLQAQLVKSDSRLQAIADSDEAIEDAAAADGMASEQDTDFQVEENPDFYPVKDYFTVDKKGQGHVKEKAVAKLAARYVS